MRTVGIIAEYNPLHNGHIYHMEQAKLQSGANHLVVIMSGNFVQRGEPACTDKMTRTEWALQAGADLVLELPTVYAVANAERFALGAVKTLAASNVITDLSFGCEEIDLRILYQLADILSGQPAEFTGHLKAFLAQGLSYPRAQIAALKAMGMPNIMTDALVKPNNILGIEYLKALKRLRSDIHPLPVMRSDSGYNSLELGAEFSSASAIRKAFREGNGDVLRCMPSFVGGPLLYDSEFPVTQNHFSSMLLLTLRKMSPEELTHIPDVAEGLENLIWKGARSAATIEQLYEQIKSKRYTLARIKRIAICALLGITNEHIYATMRGADGLYLRVLGFRNSAKPLISEIAAKASCPLIMRNADLSSCSEAVKTNINIDSLSTDLMAYATGQNLRKDYMAPIIL